MIFYLFLSLYLSPLFLIYVILCFTIPFIKYGEIKKGKGINIYIVKDAIHADYVFNFEDVNDLFPSEKKYVKVGWGDRKIFLETKEWEELKIKDFLFAFFGLNKTVLRVENVDSIPSNSRIIEINQEQLNIIKNHIQKSYNNKLIKKEKNYYQKGNYYESKLKYNCITNCNNWVNSGLKLAKITNRIWCPITFWI